MMIRGWRSESPPTMPSLEENEELINCETCGKPCYFSPCADCLDIERRAARPAWPVRDESGLAIACQSRAEAEREAGELRRADPAAKIWVEELEQ